MKTAEVDAHYPSREPRSANCDLKVDYLRLSVTDRCNLRCIYCMPASGVRLKPSEDILSYEEIGLFARCAAEEGISKVRITGGEPLVRKDVSTLIQKLTSIEGLADVSLTTNGILLKNYARELFDAGLRRINISLDSLNSQTYGYITRGGNLNSVLEGIKAAFDVGFSPVKINTVVLRGINDNLDDFVKFAYELPVCIRFIECMSLVRRNRDVVPSAELMERLGQFGELVEAPPLLGGGPAKYFRFKGAEASFGFISSVAERPCHHCTRLRLTPDGKLKTCLFAKNLADVRDHLRQGSPPGVIRSLIRQQIKGKISRRTETVQLEENILMSQIGG